MVNPKSLDLQNLYSFFNNKQVTVGVIGLGYVGLPLSLMYAESGIDTIGFDIDSLKISTLQSGKSPIYHIADNRVSKVLDINLSVTDDFSKISHCDALIICVPTPLNASNEPDLSFILDSLSRILPYIRQHQVISLESTTYPGTTEEIVKPLISRNGLVVGENIFLVYSPEREDPGNASFTSKEVPKVISGSTPNCLTMGKALYSQVFDELVPVSSTKAAEFTKLLENVHRAVNIGLVNELKIVADKMGIDIFEVIKAASTKPFGFTAYFPGPGLGGHCIPIDPYYLSWKAKQLGVETKMTDLAGSINNSMPEFVLSKITNSFSLLNKNLSQVSVLVLGVGYKKNIDDVRESSSIKLIELILIAILKSISQTLMSQVLI